MPDTEGYDLIAYDADTKVELLRWRSVAAESPGAIYAAGSTIIDGTNCWLVVGIRKTSTSRLIQIDVRLPPRL